MFIDCLNNCINHGNVSLVRTMLSLLVNKFFLHKYNFVNLISDKLRKIKQSQLYDIASSDHFCPRNVPEKRSAIWKSDKQKSLLAGCQILY